jgi:ABC-type branched-subunit amino acid transport system permease subunit
MNFTVREGAAARRVASAGGDHQCAFEVGSFDGHQIGGATVHVPQGMQEITLAVVLLLILVYRPQGIIGDRELGLATAK